MFDVKKVSIEWGGETLTLETGKVARQADGAVMATLGETVVLCAVTAAKSVKDGQDFFPLTVHYQEKYSDEEASAVVNGTSAGTITFDMETFLITQRLEQDLTMTYADNTQAELTSLQVIESDEHGIRVPEFNSTGKFASGDVFELYVKKTLRFNFDCTAHELPVEGIEVLKYNGRQSEINYGNGACDEEYTVK